MTVISFFMNGCVSAQQFQDFKRHRVKLDDRKSHGKLIDRKFFPGTLVTIQKEGRNVKSKKIIKHVYYHLYRKMLRIYRTVLRNVVHTSRQLPWKSGICPMFLISLDIPCTGYERFASRPAVKILNAFFDEDRCIYFSSDFLGFFFLYCKKEKRVFRLFISFFVLEFYNFTNLPRKHDLFHDGP